MRFAFLLVPTLLLAATGAQARDLSPNERRAYPSCDIPAQEALTPPGEDPASDPRQAHITQRIAILQADIGTLRKARHLSARKAQRLWKRADRIRTESARFVEQQGFLSAAERASYDRELDSIAGDACR